MNAIRQHEAWGRHTVIDGRQYLHFGGTSYLGMHCNPEFLRELSRQLLLWGSHFGSSRNSNLGLSIFEEAEKEFAEFFGAPAALLTSSGYMSGQLLYNYFSTSSRPLIYAPGSHPALGPANRREHNWDEIRALSPGSGAVPVLFTDSIGNNGYGWPEFHGLRDLDRDQYLVVADDSHAFGVVEGGKGCFQKLSKLLVNDVIVCGSLGKGMGMPAGIVLGDEGVIDAFRNSPVYQAASPPSPAHLATFIKTKEIFIAAHGQLMINLRQAEELLGGYDFLGHTEGYPVFTYGEPALAGHLEQNGILTTFFPYQDQLPGRIVISALHTKADLEKLTKAIASFHMA